VSALPVSVSSIFKRVGIEVTAYGRGRVPDAISALRLTKTAAEQCALTVVGDKITVYYNTDTPEAELRFRTAHELAHLVLNHKLAETASGGKKVRYTTWNQNAPTNSADEKDADRFASRLLAPACVLRAIGVTDAESIAALCGLPLPEAAERSQRMGTLITRDMFLEKGLEKRVLEQFGEFVKNYA